VKISGRLAAGAKTSYGNAGAAETPPDRLVVGPSMPPKGTRDVATKPCRLVATPCIKPTGGKVPEVETGGRAGKYPREAIKPKAVQAGESDRPYAQKLKRDRQIARHGWSAGPNPRSRGPSPVVRRRWRTPRPMKLAAGNGQNGRWVRGERKPPSPAGLSNTAKGATKSQERCRDPNEIPARSREWPNAGPVRGRQEGGRE